MKYDEMEFDEESEPEIPIYNRAELIERYQVHSCENVFNFLYIMTLFPIKALQNLKVSLKTCQRSFEESVRFY